MLIDAGQAAELLLAQERVRILAQIGRAHV